MKITVKLGRMLLVCAVAFGTVQIVAGEESSIDQQIRRSNVFHFPLEMIGSPTSVGESQELVAALEQYGTDTKSGLAASEKFLQNHPESAWAPSLRVSLAEYYRESGKYSGALEHWEKAWQATKHSDNIAGQKLAVRAFAGWTRLLASIGEKDKLKPLFAELSTLNLPLGSYSTVIEETQEGIVTMSARPQDSYRCGSYALGNLAVALHLSSSTSSIFFATKSPASGFTMSQLLELAESNGVAMEAVERPIGSKIIVPSIVHWKLNHYAAIVDVQNGRYKVMDPTFRTHVWMDADTIDAEASGAFLVSKTNAPGEWAKLSLAQCSLIYGKGIPNEIQDAGDSGPPTCDPDPNDDPNNLDDLPNSNDGPGDGTGNPSCPPVGPELTGGDSEDTSGDANSDSAYGMPKWEISEPYETLWLTDAPLLYRNSSGKWVQVILRFKHRGEDRGQNVGGFGPNWECNFIGILEEKTATPDTYSDHSFGGGIKDYNTNGTPNYKTLRSLGISAGGVPSTTSAGGAQVSYAKSASSGLGFVYHFPTQRTDRYGRTNQLQYQTTGSLVRLTNSVDTDGKSLTFAYTNATYPNLITSVTDPYNRSAYFGYNSIGLLTSITDMAGMETDFQYDTSNRITAMITRYGTTSFEYFAGVTTNYLDALTNATIRRSVRVTEASGDKQLFAYCDSGPPSAVNGEFGYARNTYHWNRAQYAAISSVGKGNVIDMQTNDYFIAPSKHWFHGNDNIDGHTVSDTVSGISKPVDSSGNRPTSYYAYTGTTIGALYAGTQKKVTDYQSASGNIGFSFGRNEYGQPTNMTYFKAGLTATYSNNYSAITHDLQTAYGPRGERIRSYGYHAVIPHLLESVTDALNQVTRYTYDTNSLKLTSIAFPSGLVHSNVYYSSGANKGFLAVTMDLGISTNSYGYTNGNLAVETNELGMVKNYLYDGLNRLVATTFPDGTSISNIYNNLDIVATRDRLNQWTYYGYNNVRQLLAVTNVAAQVTTYDYCSCGSPSQVVHWNGATPVTTYYNHNLSGDLTNITFADGYQFNFVYNPDNTIDSVTDSRGIQLSYEYVQLGKNAAISRMKWNGQSLFHKDFDEYGRVIQFTDRNFVIVTNDYDYLGRIVARCATDGFTVSTGLESFAYSTNGLAVYTNEQGKTTRFVRDRVGRLLFETNANNEMLGFTYNPSGELLSLTDGKAQVTRWSYDIFGRVTNKVDAAMNTLFVYQYDALDRLTNLWSAAKSNKVYSYDAIGNLTNVLYVSGNSTNIAYRYDQLNRLTNMLDGAGSTTFGWTDGNQLASENGPWANDTISYVYANRVRSILEIAQPNAADWKQVYNYDNLYRLSQLISPAGEFDYGYSGTAEKPDSISMPNSISIHNSYDSLMRLTDTYITRSTILDRHQYSYNEANQRTQEVCAVDLSGAGQYHYVNYTYDNVGQLKTANRFDHNYDSVTGTFSETPRAYEQLGYDYDASGNLRSRTNNGFVQNFDVDSRNQLVTANRSGTMTVSGTAAEQRGSAFGLTGVTNVTVSGTGLSSGAADLYFDGTWSRSGAVLVDGTNSYTATAKDTYNRVSSDAVTVNLQATNQFIYDLNGNLCTNDARVFDYDDENQLIRITEPNSWKTEFTYDGLFRMRIRREFVWNGLWIQTNEVRYVYDGFLVIQDRNADNIPSVTYTRGDDLSGTLDGAGGIGGLLARTDNGQLITGSPIATAYYFSDGSGNITSLICTNGSTAANYCYDPFGKLLTIRGSLAAANKYRFSSKEADSRTGLYVYGFRFYDPNLQRWLNKDPIEERGGINLFNFVGNSPYLYYDAFGLCDEGSVQKAAEDPEQLGKFARDFLKEAESDADASIKERQAAEDALKSSRRQATDDLRKALKTGENESPHHNIPYEFRNNDLVKQAAEGKWNLNGVNNGTNLPKDLHPGLKNWNRWHKLYNQMVKDRLNQALAENPNMTAPQAAQKLQQIGDYMGKVAKAMCQMNP